MQVHRRTLVRRVIAVTTALGIAAAVTACASPEQASSGGNSEISLDATLVDAARAKAAEITDGEKIGGSLEVINENGGREGAILQAAFAPFTEATGVKINFTGTTDYNNVISSRLQAGNPPDVGTMSIGAIQDILEHGDTVVNLTDVIGAETLADNFNTVALESASVDGDVYGIYQGFSNYMLWYNPQHYTGPTSGPWSDVQSWTDETAATGTTPWCIAEEAGPATGAVGSQWIQELFVKKYGAEKARQWGTGELAWTSPEVKDAFQLFGSIAGVDANVNGGVAGSLSESFATGSSGLVSDPPKCEAVLWGSWAAALINASSDGVEAGENLDFIPVPASSDEFANTEAFSANAQYAFTDTPATRAFMEYIASAEEQTLLASADNWVVSNTNVPPDTYGSPLLQKTAETYFADDVVLAVTPTQLSSAAVNVEFWQGVVSYLTDPTSLDDVLAGIQAAQDAS